MLAAIIIMNTLMVYYLVRQKYWLYMLLEMMSIKGETDFGHAIVILFSNQFKSPNKLTEKSLESGIQSFHPGRKG